jgi:DNA-directed RNA polymerase alpha subunit
MYKLFKFEEPISNDKFLPIELTGVDSSICNALRRIFMSEVPTVAFDEKNIDLVLNETNYHRQVIIERIGAITINCNKLLQSDPNSPLDDIVFLISDQTDPLKPLKNETNQILKVNLHQCMSIRNSKTNELYQIEKYIPYNSLIVTLNPDEAIHAIMKATWGIKQQHPKWQSSICMYKYTTAIDQLAKDGQNPNRVETNEEQMAYLGRENGSPESVILTIESVGKLDSNKVVIRGIQKLMDKLEVFKMRILSASSVSETSILDEYNQFKKLLISEKDFTFEQIVKNGPILLQRLKFNPKDQDYEFFRQHLIKDPFFEDPEIFELFRQCVFSDVRSNLKIEEDDTITNLIKFKITGEDHTLGNILETMCLKTLQGLISSITEDKSEQLDLILESLSAYKKSHPLNDYVEFSIRAPHTKDLVFPTEIPDLKPSLKVVLMTIKTVQDLCRQLLDNAKTEIF